MPGLGDDIVVGVVRVEEGLGHGRRVSKKQRTRRRLCTAGGGSTGILASSPDPRIAFMRNNTEVSAITDCGCCIFYKARSTDIIMQ